MLRPSSRSTRSCCAGVARHAATLATETAHKSGIQVGTAFAPAPVTGDPVLLERLCHNLLDNALRYNTEHGWVRLATGTADGHAYLTVENTGVPVPSDAVDGLFEPFRRLAATDRLTDPDPTRPGRGAGLGLSIVRSIVHAHGGQVRAEPRPDGGLTVHIRIPAAPGVSV